MNKVFFILTFTACALFSNCISAEASPQQQEALKIISEFIHPNMAKIWETFFSNFESDKIVAWNFSEKTGHFTIHLKNPLKFWIPASKTTSNDPRPGSILIFGINNKVEGRLNTDKKSIDFTHGFKIYCKYKIGFLTIPVMVDVYSFAYKNEDNVIFEAGKAGVSEKRSKSLDKYLTSWANPSNVVSGDHELYLKIKSQ